MALTKVTYSMIYGSELNVVDFGADPSGVNNSSAAIQAALDLRGSVYIPDGTYRISTDLVIKSNTCVTFGQKAVLKAGANNITFFKSNSTTNAYQVQVHNAQLDGNGFTGVTGFDMYNFRLNAGLFNPYMTAVNKGIVFRYGCFGTVIENPTTYDNVYYPVCIMDNCAEVRISNPNFDGTGISPTGTIGIEIQVGATIGANLGCRVDGGYIQGFETGVYDRGVGTQINGTYFESCVNTDILASSASQCTYTSTQHWSNTGNSAVQGISSDGITIFSLAMGSGARYVGVLNFNNSNTNCTYICAATTSFRNTPIGVTTGVSFSIKDNNILCNKVVATAGYQTNSNSFTIATATASTMFAISAANRGRYDVVSLIANSGSAADYTATATVIWDGAQARLIANDGVRLTTTVSGANVQVTQTSGSNQTVYWSYTFTPI
jgi:hypothetical protein